MSKMAQLMAMKNDYQAKLKEMGKEAVAEQLKSLFDAHPELLGLRWTQYTPYFNDGDVCEFVVNTVYYRTAEIAADAGDYEDGFESPSWDEKKRTPLENAVRNFRLADDVALIAFGDHVQVTATRDGVEVEEYSHD